MNSYPELSWLKKEGDMPYQCTFCGVVLTLDICDRCLRQHGKPSTQMPLEYCQECYNQLYEKKNVYSRKAE